METRKTDIIISGQGLAGSVLAYTLIKRGLSVLVVNDERIKSATSVAAGLFNPVTGKKMALTWKASQLFPFLLQFYEEVEKDTGQDFLHKRPVFRPFPTDHEKELWLESAGKEVKEFVQVVSGEKYAEIIHNRSGGIETRYSGNIDTPAFLSAVRDWLSNRHAYLDGKIGPEEVEVKEDSVHWMGISAGKLIFCEGYRGKDNPWFGWLPFSPVKGEIAGIETRGLDPDVIFNKYMFIVPGSGNAARAGATYCWDIADEEPRPEGKAELEEKLCKFLKHEFRVTEMKAGIRPATADRKPFIGLHPQYKSLAIFNGLGTKGVSLAPYFAAQFADFLQGKGNLDPEVNISRFFPLQ